MTQRKPIGLSWEAFVEQQIVDAQQAGEFDNLSGFGKPLDDLGDPADELWWLRRKMRREKLSVTPPSLEIRLDIERTLKRVLELETVADVQQTLEALNQRIQRANMAAIWGPPSTAMPLPIEPVLARWRLHQARKRDA